MTVRFQCSSCGEEHDGFPDYAYVWPDYYANLSEHERTQRASASSEICVLDERDRFIRGVLPIPLRDTSDYLGLGVWMSVSEKNLKAYIHYDAGDIGEAPWMVGYLSNQLPGFPPCLEVVLGTQPHDPKERPLFTVSPSAHPLSKLHHWGIPIAEAASALEPLLHRPHEQESAPTAMAGLSDYAAKLPAWPYDEPGNLGVLTLRQVVDGSAPVLFVSRDQDDGGWQFLDGGEPRTEEATIECLRHTLARDESLQELGDLPRGWLAWRATRSSAWTREEASECD